MNSTKTRDLFIERSHFKPFDYPECEQFVDAINESYWTHKEWSFSQDVQQYHTELDDYQKEIIKKCLLLISQIEVSVKTFWGNLYNHIPLPEINMVGSTFSESEVRHERAYSHLLEKLGLNEEFEKIYEIPAIIDRHNYLKKYKDFSNARLEEKFLRSIILFSLFIENVSLFSQFFVVMSFNKHRKMLKDINNAVAATSKEEAIHGAFGTWLINQIREEHPEFFTDELKSAIRTYCIKAFAAEEKVIDWIFDKGDTDFIKVDQIKEFVKNRLNQSLTGIGLDAIFEVDKDIIAKTKWFEEELFSDVHVDFFDQRPTAYSRKNKSITADDLF
jgi:ribonucleoside-diphosphate reductase beta chain